MKLYQPSNGSEGCQFMAEFCERCQRQPINPAAKHQCKIQLRAMICDARDPEYPPQWRYGDNGQPVCTSFRERGKQKRTSKEDKFTGKLF